jgi:hypothetical protein
MTSEINDLTCAEIFNSIITELKRDCNENRPPTAIRNTTIERQWLVYIADEILRVSRKLGYDLFMNDRDGYGYVFNGDIWKNIKREKLIYFINAAILATGIDQCIGKSYQFQKKLYKQFVAEAFRYKPMEPIKYLSSKELEW